MGFGKGHHLHLIDGSAFIFRAYHALPPLTRKSDGLPIGAVSGFCNMLNRYIEDNNGPDAPTHVAVIFDHSSYSFRNDIYDGYKANRPPAPEDLVPQFPLTREATKAFNIACEEMEGFEADDMIATLAFRARDAGGRVTIISSDKDLMQLVGNGIEMYDAMKNKRIDREGVFEKFGVYPDRVIDVQALAGDSVDNVPGAPGIGIKTAATLISEFGSLDELLRRADEIKQPKRRQTLIDNAEQIKLSRELVTLDCKTPLKFELEDLEFNEPVPNQLLDFLAKMEFRTLTKRISQKFDVEMPTSDILDTDNKFSYLEEIAFDNKKYELSYVFQNSVFLNRSVEDNLNHVLFCKNISKSKWKNLILKILKEFNKSVSAFLYSFNLSKLLPLLYKASAYESCLLYTSPSPRDVEESRMPSSA